MTGGDQVDREDLQFGAGGTVAAEPLGSHLTLEEVERIHIERVLAEEKGRVARAAERLGVSRSSLYDRLRRFGIHASDS